MWKARNIASTVSYSFSAQNLKLKN
jgi:ABC-type multidrug transport system fused ATPase/permease subunit